MSERMKLGRPKNAEEAEEYRDLQEVTAEVTFIDRVTKHNDEFVKAHKPFCRKCALEEFKMEKEILLRTLKLKHPGKNLTEKEPPFIDLANKFDLSKYGKPEYFKLVGELRNNIRRREGGDVWFELNVNKDYVCKTFGHKCCVSICQSEMNADEIAVEEKRKTELKKKVTPAEGVPHNENKGLPVGNLGDSAVLNPLEPNKLPK